MFVRIVVIGTLDTEELFSMGEIEYIRNAVMDVDGNLYDAVCINGKTWLASNLRTTRFSDGEKIGRYANSKLGKLPYFEYPYGCERNPNKLRKCGLHYNFEAVNTGVLAPKGWRVSSIEDWTELLTFLGKSDIYNIVDGEMRPYLAATAKSLCIGETWRKSDVENSVGCRVCENNVTGFGMYPNGRSLDIKKQTGYVSYIWCSDVYPGSDEYTWMIRTWYKDIHIVGAFCARAFGLGVRCVKC